MTSAGVDKACRHTPGTNLGGEHTGDRMFYITVCSGYKTMCICWNSLGFLLKIVNFIVCKFYPRKTDQIKGRKEVFLKTYS